MNKKHEYNGKIIQNVPLNGQNRYFIFEEDGTRSMNKDKTRELYPQATLKDAKLLVDRYFEDEE